MTTRLAETSAPPEVVRRLQESIAHILRKDAAAIDVSRTLPHLGLDSVAMMQFVEVFESEFCAEFPSVHPERMTLESLAMLVGERGNMPVVELDPFAQLSADSVLPADVYANAHSVATLDPT